MIQLDEKLPSQNPPPYDAQPEGNAGAGYPPPHQSPPRGGPSTSGVPSPLGGYQIQQPPASYAGSPRGVPSQAALDAQMGNMYQQQLLAQCARGRHDVVTNYGPCGIISAVILFPFGLICLFADRHKKCARCGERML